MRMPRRRKAVTSSRSATIAFLNIGMHGHINPTLPVAAELVRRAHTVTYHTSPAFQEKIEATGATVHLYPGGDPAMPDPPMPVTLMEALARTSVRLLPAVLTDLRRIRPDVIVHDSAWSAAGCVAVAGVTLGAAAEGVRRLVVRKKPTGRPEVTA
ncbi:hypothetical protein [Streptomyces sp. NPDC006285]|uniref:hypothetical protein n=1 Tax=Streptomyces sp. NPDC006285 TaxID=3364742 RepID=UPI0036B58149